MSVANISALVTTGDLERCKEEREIVLQKFDKDYTEACVIEGEEVLTQSTFPEEMEIAVNGRRRVWCHARRCTNQLEKKKGPICTKD